MVSLPFILHVWLRFVTDFTLWLVEKLAVFIEFVSNISQTDKGTPTSHHALEDHLCQFYLKLTFTLVRQSNLSPKECSFVN